MRAADIHPSPEGYLILFAWVFAEQIGLPLPAAPALIAAGALAGAGTLHLALLIVVALIASVLADYLWYRAGIFRRDAMGRFLRRYADSQVMQNARHLLARFGKCSLVFAKFVPGLSLAAPPLSGMSGTSTSQFLLLDTIGSLAWAGAFIGTGYYFGNTFTSSLASVSPRLCLWLCGTFVLGFATIQGARSVWRRVPKPMPPSAIASSNAQIAKEESAALTCVARLITGETTSPETVVDFQYLNETVNLFFAHWMTLWWKKLVIARSLAKITIELEHSAGRTALAKYSHGSTNLPSAEWSRQHLVDEVQLQRAVSGIDVFPRCVLLLTYFERLSLEDEAVLLNASKELVIRAQTIGLAELANNLACAQARASECRVPSTPVLDYLQPAI
jgi:membrane protein DedA with SNARE-associated domain